MKMTAIPVLLLFLFAPSNVYSQSQSNNRRQPDLYDESQYRTFVKFQDIVNNIKVKVPDDGPYRNGTGAPFRTELGDPLGYIFSVTGYYPGGEPVFVYNKFCTDKEAKNCSRDGKEVWYYKSGKILREGFNNGNGFQGYVTYYNEDGSIRRKELYQNGKPIVANRFSIPEGCPLIGQWKLVAVSQPNDNRRQAVPDKLNLIIYENSITVTTTRNSLNLTETEYANWKYIPQSSGLVDYSEYEGDDLVGRGAIRWVNSNEFEITVSFSRDSKLLGMKLVFRRR